MKKGKFSTIIYAVLTLILCATLVLSPKKATEFASNGLILCANVIIPSLFPINFCVIFIMKLLNGINFKKTKPIFIFIFSLLGGYPTGAKLLDEEVKSGNIDEKTAKRMICFCTNAGMGFIVSAVGFGIYGSKIIGFLLFFCHCLSSLILSFFFSRKCSFKTEKEPTNKNLADLFTLSASETSSTILSICSFVLFFSVVNGFLLSFKATKFLCFLTEITSALTLTKNIYLTAFLLSFGGISIWCQVISVSKNFRINLGLFLLSRILSGIISASLMFLSLKVLRLPIAVFSNNVSFIGKAMMGKPSVTLSLVIMIILLIISLEGKKSGGNLGDDLLK